MNWNVEQRPLAILPSKFSRVEQQLNKTGGSTKVLIWALEAATSIYRERVLSNASISAPNFWTPIKLAWQVLNGKCLKRKGPSSSKSFRFKLILWRPLFVSHFTREREGSTCCLDGLQSQFLRSFLGGLSCVEEIRPAPKGQRPKNGLRFLHSRKIDAVSL